MPIDLRGWLLSDTGLGVSGKTVEAFVSGTVTPGASGVTDSDGQWQFASLSDATWDVRMTAWGRRRWLRGGRREQFSKVAIVDGLMLGSVATVSGLVPAHLPAHASLHENGGADEISVLGLSGLLADAQTPLAHNTSHQNGGADEISVLGLSGLLADAQTPLVHNTSHQNGGADEISVAGLSGLLADGQTPLAHAASHAADGSDELGILAEQSANVVLAGPTTGAAADPAYRALVLADLPSVPMARAYHSADQAIADSTETALALNSERFDTDTIHDTAVNNSRLTCKTAGTYLIGGHFAYAANAVGRRQIQAFLNGTIYIAAVELANLGATIPTYAQISTLYDLAVNDYVELRAYQTSGGNLNVRALANYTPEFWMVRL